MNYKTSLYKFLFLSALSFIFICNCAFGQLSILSGAINSQNKPVALASVKLSNTNFGATTDSLGFFIIRDIPSNTYKLSVSCIGYNNIQKNIDLRNNNRLTIRITLDSNVATLNDVVVTGVSKSTRIKENPVAIVAISQKSIEQTIESNTIDAIAKNAPGLQVVKTGPNVSKPFINGLGYNRVLTLYDGVLRVETQQWGDEHGVPMDDYIIGKAEVIEGPSSLMYGSDAIAGVVSMFNSIPQQTDNKLHGKFISEYQTNNGLIGNSLSLMHGGKHWSYAVRGSERFAKNYRDPVDGYVYLTNFRMYNASAFLGYKSDYGYSHFNISLYDNRQGIPDGSRDSLTRQFTYQVYESPGENIIQPYVDTIKNRPLVPKDLLNSYKVSALSQRIQDYRVYTDNLYHIGERDIKATLGYEQNIRREFDHPIKPSQAGEYIVLNTIDYAIRYNTPTILNIEPSVGITGMYQTNTIKAATDFPIPNYNLFDIGAYLYGNWKHNKWTIAGGIRYDHRSENGSSFYTKASPDGFYREVSGSDTIGAKENFIPFHFSLQGVTGSIGATYQLSNQISFKANISRGYRAPNITELASNGLDPGAHIYYIGNLSFKPEFSLQEDAGIIGTLQDVSFGASIFYNRIENYIYEDLKVDASGNPVEIIPGNKTFQYQQTDAQLYGLNATLNVHPQDWKAFQFNYSFSMVYGDNLNSKYSKAGVEGRYLPFIPPPHLLSDVSYAILSEKKAVQSLTIKAEADYNAAQNRYLGLYNTETPTADYTLLNTSVAANIHYAKEQLLTLAFAVNNVFNTAYQNHLSRLQYFEYYTQSPNGHLGIYNMGRNVCVKLIMNF